MNEDNITNLEDVNTLETVSNEDKDAIGSEEKTYSKKEEFDTILDKIKMMSEALELHTDVKKAVESNEVEDNYLKYIENALEDKLFCDAKFDKLKSKILIEVVLPNLINIENFDVKNLSIDDIGSHFENGENYIDKICVYKNKFICLFGVNENNSEKVLKYELRKFTRVDMIEAIKLQCKDIDNYDIYQYDEYYIVDDKKEIKVYSERKVTALVAVKETIFDKIKSKFSSLFSKKSIFGKKKFLPTLNLIYETNPNRFENFETNKSKVDAKNRMKVLLNKEREIVRGTEN